MPWVKSRGLEAPSWFTEVTEMEYLEVTLDDRWGFRNQVRKVAGKAAPMFQRIRQNVASTWGLSGQTTRRLYLGVFVPRMVYGAAVWGETVNDRMMKRLLLGAQRGALLSVTGAYRTTSTEALPVLAGVLPLDLEARQWGRRARRRRLGLGKEKEVEIEEEEGIAEWQARWEASEKGRLTFSYFPSVKKRLKCKWLVVDHESSQFLTGHVGFMAYLHRFSKSETDECPACGTSDTT